MLFRHDEGCLGAAVTSTLEALPTVGSRSAEWWGGEKRSLDERRPRRQPLNVAHNGLILEMDHPTSGRIAVPELSVKWPTRLRSFTAEHVNADAHFVFFSCQTQRTLSQFETHRLNFLKCKNTTILLAVFTHKSSVSRTLLASYCEFQALSPKAQYNEVCHARFYRLTGHGYFKRVPCMNNVQNGRREHSALCCDRTRGKPWTVPAEERSVPLGPAVRFSSFEYSQAMPPPAIGQHTVQVLRGTLGYSDDVINQLLASRTVTQNDVQ
ncbi:hypothetical protein E1301_Tti000801 [Triplophysa tibetana]|uniref:Uncharacterized protein n=1 Tax=Triplophysa tibetana TaxID=1572043 RepID=A0A5A9N4D9_9TELE|nr:hypothetical protein E1301_Tti000801 [Triplophysa tibetana]